MKIKKPDSAFADAEFESFVDGYIEALIFTDTPDSCWPGRLDIASESLETIRADCATFWEQNQAVLDIILNSTCDYDADHAGHDFCLTRNGHGADFWDRDELPEKARGILTESARGFGESYTYVTDDNLLGVE